MEWLKRAICLCMILLLSGCAMVGTYMDPHNPAPAYHVNGQLVQVHYVDLTPTWVLRHDKVHSYRVGPYDILNMIVWEHPNLTTLTTQLSGASQSGFLVSAHGNIAFPLIGNVHVAGLTLPEIQTVVAQRLSKYIVKPQITARVVVFRSQEAQLLGELGQQKTIPLTDKPTSLLDAMNSVGGTNVLTANTTRVFVVRGNMTHLTVLGLNLKSPQMMMVAQRLYLKNNDIVYVPPLGVTNWNRVISQLAPTIAIPPAVKGTAQSF